MANKYNFFGYKAKLRERRFIKIKESQEVFGCIDKPYLY